MSLAGKSIHLFPGSSHVFFLVAATHHYYAILPVYEGDTVDFPSEEKELIFVEYFFCARLFFLNVHRVISFCKIDIILSTLQISEIKTQNVGIHPGSQAQELGFEPRLKLFRYIRKLLGYRVEKGCKETRQPLAWFSLWLREA